MRETELINLAVSMMIKDAGLGAGGAQATVASTGFTPTFGGGGDSNICDKCKKKKECKALAGNCEQGWGVWVGDGFAGYTVPAAFEGQAEVSQVG